MKPSNLGRPGTGAGLVEKTIGTFDNATKYSLHEDGSAGLGQIGP